MKIFVVECLLVGFNHSIGPEAFIHVVEMFTEVLGHVIGDAFVNDFTDLEMRFVRRVKG
jgi:hypothetical protein